MADELAELGELNATINNNEVLSESPGVQQAQKAVNDEAEKSKSAFGQSAQVVSQLNSSIKVWENPSSNAADITSSTLSLISSVLFASAAIPGVDVITAPLGLIVGLFGAVVGAFGAKPETNYYDVLNRMLDDAVEQLNSELVNEQLAGALKDMRDSYWTISDILDKGPVPKDAPIIQDYKVDDFTTAADDAIGASFDNLKDNLSYDNRDNWGNAAETYYRLAQVIAFKAMYVSQGISLFKVLDANTSDPGRRAGILLDYMRPKFPSDALGDMAPYMVKPDLGHGAITQAIYCLEENKFRTIGQLLVFLIEHADSKHNESCFWPGGASQYRFEVTDSSASDHGKDVVRLSTWYDRVDKNPPRVLFDSDHFHSCEGDDYTPADTHWMLWADTDKFSPQPYYRWYIQAVNKQKQRGLFIFEVVPSSDEISRYDIPDTRDNTLLIIGNVGNGEIWRASHEDHDLHDSPYADLVSGKHNAHKCLWVLLDEDG